MIPPPQRGSRGLHRGEVSPWWRHLLAAVRRASWTLKLMAVAAAVIVGYPLFDAIDTAVPHPPHKRGDVWVCDLKTLSSFELDQVHGQTRDIPRAFRDLDGKRVEMAGQMWAPYRADGRVRDFDLVYSVANCCFCGPPKVQHLVKAKLRNGASIRYQGGRVEVTGTLHVGVQTSGDSIESVYRVDVDSVEPD